MTDNTKNESTNDINDIFDNILLTEENLVSQGNLGYILALNSLKSNFFLI
jgi:hypothetical protein